MKWCGNPTVCDFFLKHQKLFGWRARLVFQKLFVKVETVKDLIKDIYIASRISISIRKSQIRCRAKRFGPERKLSKPILVSNFQRYHWSQNCQMFCVKFHRLKQKQMDPKIVNWMWPLQKESRIVQSNCGRHLLVVEKAHMAGDQVRILAWFQQRWLQIDFWVCSKRQGGDALHNPCFTCVVLRRQQWASNGD